MGLMDTIKGWFAGNKPQVKDGIDRGRAPIKDKVPDPYDSKVDSGAETAKDAVDKID